MSSSLPLWAEIVVGLLVLVALAAAHIAFWAWRYRVLPQQDELRFAPTQDGWEIALARRKPRGAPRLPPVLLCHGLAANRANLDFGVDRYSVSLDLASAGFDCFALDLRGHGASRRSRKDAPRRWSFDTYLKQDIPAALDEIKAATGSAQVLWVGHSQGALLGLAAAAAWPERIAGVVAIAPPTHFHAQNELRRVLRFAFLATGRQRWLVRAASPIAGYLHTPFAQFALNTRNTDPRVLRQLMCSVVEDISPGVLAQFLNWARSDVFVSVDGNIDYRGGLASARKPALFIAGSRDLLAPPGAVRAGYELWGGEKEIWVAGRDSGLSADYGHSDLIFGVRAKEEIFPRIREWLLQRSQG
jgi:pimeloyl-ACP methyl ester carboxylesterase